MLSIVCYQVLMFRGWKVNLKLILTLRITNLCFQGYNVVHFLMRSLNFAPHAQIQARNISGIKYTDKYCRDLQPILDLLFLLSPAFGTYFAFGYSLSFLVTNLQHEPLEPVSSVCICQGWFKFQADPGVGRTSLLTTAADKNYPLPCCYRKPSLWWCPPASFTV